MRRHSAVFAASLLLVSLAHAQPVPRQGTPPPRQMPRFTLKPAVKGTAAAHKYTKQQITRGAYLTNAGGCDDCHTAKVFDAKANMPVPDMTRRLAGHPEGAPDPYSTLAPGDQLVVGPTFTSFKTEFGVAYAANLTPDVETGSGAWSEEVFLKIFRTGKHLGTGRPILPPMPWSAVARLSDDDIRAMFAYLRSLPPVKNKVTVVTLPEPALRAIEKMNSMMLAPPPGASR